MYIRLTLGFLIATTIACGTSGPGDTPTASSFPPSTPAIVQQSIEFHGGALYEASTITMTISSLSGSFEIEPTRDGGQFEHIVTGTRDDTERRVRLTNDTVQEWRNGEEIDLDEETATRARAYVDARVFFPLLPYTLKGGDIQFDDLGLETWHGRDLHKVRVSFTPGTSNDADDAYIFWFDPDTGQMEQFGYDFDGGLRLRTATSFERVGGVLFSTQENYAIDGGRVPVNMLSPEYVEENMELLSTVTVSNMSVEPL